jgi:ribonuclease VapC
LRKRGEQDAADLLLLIEKLLIEIIAFDEAQAVLAREAYLRFGKGRHPAALNYGDCFSYALAKTLGEPLLYKGNDFSHTDVLSA